MKRGLFVTVEGTDGCGKTTQIRNIIDHLSSLGCRVVLTREPGGTRISENIRSIILDPTFTEMHSITELMLYSAARAQLVEQVIKPSIAKSETVICDRYIDSFYAYQGYGRGLDMDMLKKITSLAIDDMIPDITIFLDLDPEIGLRRRMNAANGDRIENEQIEFHRRVYDGYKQLARENPDRIKTIDASRSVEEVWQDVRRQLDMALGFVREI
ncbi:MAG TPA: dTMP kinase [Clostridiales bacterium]|nr:dTMP kinase [Clostridiales bacterium]HPZ05200.1 dTMP kinase [Clostridiales bacterium]HQD31093.1 dTMP kinase [Clostridiales bacterium]